MKYATLMLGLTILLASVVVAAAVDGDFQCRDGVRIEYVFDANSFDLAGYSVKYTGKPRSLDIKIKMGKPITITVNGQRCQWTGESE